MARRRVSLRESYRKATAGHDAPGPGLGFREEVSTLVALWYWMVGEPVREDEAAAVSEH